MRNIRYLLLLLLAAPLISLAQVQTIGLANSSRFRMADQGSEGHLIAAEHRYGFDSSWVELSRLDLLGNATHLAAYRVSDPLWFLFDGIDAGDGMVVAGTLTSTYVPHLVRFDDNGAVTWAKSFAGMQFSQTRFAVLLSNGFNGFAFSNADNFSSTGMYRARFDAATGDNHTILQVTTSPTLNFRGYCGVQIAGYGQAIGGSGVIANGDYQALLARFDDSGCQWMKLYQLGSVDVETEEIVGVASTPSGGFACVMNRRASASTTEGLFMITDAEGQPVSGVRLSDPSGINLSTVFPLLGGAYLVAGSTNAGRGMLFVFGSDGSLVWSRRCEACVYATMNSIYYGGGMGGIHGLGPAQDYSIGWNGDACGFEAVSTVTATAFLPTVTSIAPQNNLSPAVTTGPFNLLPRASTSSASVLCSATGVHEPQANRPLRATPNPVERTLLCEGASPNERFVVFDMRGNLLFDGPYRNGIDMSTLAPGVYGCLMPRTLQRAQVVKQ